MTGASVLDQLTRERNLDLFVLLSSFTTVIGNAKQSNYVAANLFLEALARCRRRDGLPAFAMALGVLGETGYASRQPELMSFLTRFLPPLSPTEALDALDRQLVEGTEVAAVGRVDWGETSDYLPALRVPRLAGVLPDTTADHPGQGDEALRRAIAEGTRDEAHTVILEAVTKVVGDILHIAPDRLDPHRPLSQLGLDSLMATEVISAIQRRFGCVIPTLEVIGAEGLVPLARLVHAQLAQENPATRRHAQVIPDHQEQI
jgi:acyl carrier protein